MNTQTGQHSRDLPLEADDELSDADFGVSSPPRSRSGTGIGTAYGQVNGGRPSNGGPVGFGLPKRSGTPEPWIRRLADDGLTYFYVNKLDGSVRWTLPEASSTPRSNGLATPTTSMSHSTSDSAKRRDADGSSSRMRGDSSTSFFSRERSDSAAGLTSVYSDDSDVDPLERLRGSTKRLHASNSSRTMDSRQGVSQVQSQSHPHPATIGQTDLTSAEKLAQALQNTLAPAPPESLTDLSGVARQAVASVITYIQGHGVFSRVEEQEELEGRIADAVVSIRNLLSISSPPYGHISSSLYPKDGPSPPASALAQSMQAQLKPAQRRVTATLSKLVLAALAAQYDANSFASDAPSRMEADAGELDRALVTFVLEVQRTNNSAAGQTQRKPMLRRLRATLASTNVGLGLSGAGAAGDWKGFGWVMLPDGNPQPSRALGVDVLTAMKTTATRLDEKLSVLQTSAMADPSAGKLSYSIKAHTLTMMVSS